MVQESNQRSSCETLTYCFRVFVNLVGIVLSSIEYVQGTPKVSRYWELSEVRIAESAQPTTDNSTAALNLILCR